MAESAVSDDGHCEAPWGGVKHRTDRDADAGTGVSPEREPKTEKRKGKSEMRRFSDLRGGCTRVVSYLCRVRLASGVHIVTGACERKHNQFRRDINLVDEG